MRLMVWFAFVALMSGTEIERAQRMARGRDSEREQFHRQYIFKLPDPAVTQIEVVTEFRRLVLVSEEHILRGDWLFSRGLKLAEEALAPSRGLVTIKAFIRFNPLNNYVIAPAYVLALGAGPGSSAITPIDTQLSPQYSLPFRGPDKKQATFMVGANLESNVSGGQLGQTSRAVGVMLDGKEAARTTVDFAKLD